MLAILILVYMLSMLGHNVGLAMDGKQTFRLTVQHCLICSVVRRVHFFATAGKNSNDVGFAPTTYLISTLELNCRLTFYAS